MSCDNELRNSISGSDLDFAVVTAKDNAFARLHQSHADAVVRDVDRVVDTTANRVSPLVGSMRASSLPTLVRLLELHIAIHGLPWLPESISELLLEI